MSIIIESVLLEESIKRGLLVDIYVDVEYEHSNLGVSISRVSNNDSDITNELSETEFNFLLQQCDDHYPKYLEQCKDNHIDQLINERSGK